MPIEEDSGKKGKEKKWITVFSHDPRRNTGRKSRGPGEERFWFTLRRSARRKKGLDTRRDGKGVTGKTSLWGAVSAEAGFRSKDRRDLVF